MKKLLTTAAALVVLLQPAVVSTGVIGAAGKHKLLYTAKDTSTHIMDDDYTNRLGNNLYYAQKNINTISKEKKSGQEQEGKIRKLKRMALVSDDNVVRHVIQMKYDNEELTKSHQYINKQNSESKNTTFTDWHSWVQNYSPFQIPEIVTVREDIANNVVEYIRSSIADTYKNSQFIPVIEILDNLLQDAMAAADRAQAYSSLPSVVLGVDAAQDIFLFGGEGSANNTLRRVLDTGLYSQEFKVEVEKQMHWLEPLLQAVSTTLSYLYGSDNNVTDRATTVTISMVQPWSQLLSSVVQVVQAITGDANTLLRETGRFLFPQYNVATITDAALNTRSTLTCSGCVTKTLPPTAANVPQIHINLSELFYFLSSLVGPLVVVGLPLAALAWYLSGGLAVYSDIDSDYYIGMGTGYGTHSGYGDRSGNTHDRRYEDYRDGPSDFRQSYYRWSDDIEQGGRRSHDRRPASGGQRRTLRRVEARSYGGGLAGSREPARELPSDRELLPGRKLPHSSDLTFLAETPMSIEYLDDLEEYDPLNRRE